MKPLAAQSLKRMKSAVVMRLRLPAQFRSRKTSTTGVDEEGGGEGDGGGGLGNGGGGDGDGGGGEGDGVGGDGWLVWPSSATAAACTLAAESTGSHCGGGVWRLDRRSSADGPGSCGSKKSHPHSCQPSLVQPFTLPESRV